MPRIAAPPRFQIGDKIGRWAVLGIPEQKKKYRLIVCQCECGTVKKVRESRLSSDSLGCWECARKNFHTKHGLWKTSEYSIWGGMKRRCYSSNHASYRDYGGRGIQVCDRWLGADGFKNFIADVGRRPSKRHTLDRKDVDGKYSPSNCRWATATEQLHNRRKFCALAHYSTQELFEEIRKRINLMAKVKRDNKDPMPSARNSQRVGGGNEPYPAGAEGHGDGTAERVTASQNRTTGPEAMRVAQPTRQNGDGNTTVTGESHSQSKAQQVKASQRW